MDNGSQALQEIYRKAARGFGINVKKLVKDIPLFGSPERSVFRMLLEDKNQDFYVLESVLFENIQRKEQIATNLDAFARNNLAGVVSYLPAKKGGHIVYSDYQYWLMSNYVAGKVLKRPDYVFDEWRGKVLADFLIGLKRTAKTLFNQDEVSFFSIESYIENIMVDIKNNDPEYLIQFLPFFERLKEHFFYCHDALPRIFCHGDFHPMNIIWGKDSIRAVIDWEFSGIKPEAYDIANLLGCLGMEHPHALTGKLVLSCLKILKEAEFIAPESWDSLLDFVLAIRFAWLAEWLRRKDLQMIEMERKYMEILLDNAYDLQSIWGL